jgi:hypothetical protein
VKPGLSSKRQQSEPPLTRNVFPPTPPPESEKVAALAPLSRGASVRNGPKPMPAKLNIDKARPKERYEIRGDGSQDFPPPAQLRIGTTRTASEPRGPPSRQFNPEGRRRGSQRRRASDEEGEDEYPGELYDMYRNSRTNRSTGTRRMQPKFIEEEEEYASDYEDGSFDENEFEMISNRAPVPRSRAQSTSGAGGRAASRRPEISKVRVKVHADDVRYIMVGTAVDFPDFVDKVREKFGMRKRFKIKIRDEDMPNGDMITMGDQDDLDMLMMSVKSNARKERLDMGKMDVSKSPYQVRGFSNRRDQC